MEFKSKRLRASEAYKAGDAKIFESDCGQYRIVLVRRAFGVNLPEHYHAIFITRERDVVSNEYRLTQVHLNPERNVRAFKSAVAICKRHAAPARAALVRPGKPKVKS